jgi:hypothetical protein
MEHPLAGVNGTKEPVPGILYLRQPEKSVSSVRNDNAAFGVLREP